MRRSSIGSSTDSSMTTKIDMVSAPKASRPRTRYELQPQFEPSERASSRAKRLLDTKAKPAASSSCVVPAGQRGQHQHGGHQPQDPDGHVDVEYQPPVDVLHQVAAQGGTEGGGEDDAEPVEA